jgi:hypothetical protein
MVPEAIPVSDWSYTNFFSIKLLGELDQNFVRMVYGNRSAFYLILIQSVKQTKGNSSYRIMNYKIVLSSDTVSPK